MEGVDLHVEDARPVYRRAVDLLADDRYWLTDQREWLDHSMLIPLARGFGRHQPPLTRTTVLIDAPTALAAAGRLADVPPERMALLHDALDPIMARRAA